MKSKLEKNGRDEKGLIIVLWCHKLPIPNPTSQIHTVGLEPATPDNQSHA